MAQVRPEYPRWIVPYFWNTGAHLGLPEEALRGITITTLPKFREDVVAVLKTLTTERFMEIRDTARVWLCGLSASEQERVLRQYDEQSPRLPMPYRIDWTKRVPFMHPGALVDTSV